MQLRIGNGCGQKRWLTKEISADFKGGESSIYQEKNLLMTTRILSSTGGETPESAFTSFGFTMRRARSLYKVAKHN
jgi:hypothetical protein